MCLEYIQQILAWILPRICVCCGFNSEELYIDLCAYCKANLPWIEDRCYSCGERLEAKAESVVCAKCHETRPAYNRVCALFAYQAPVNKFINQLKFSRKIYLASLFAQLLAEAVICRWYLRQQLPEVIIPVPLHKKRQRKRGYNQALEICKPLAKILRIPINYGVLIRIKYTQQQSRLDKSERQQNLHAAFKLVKTIKYKHVALLDDVVTTGSTIKAICQILLAAGVESIDVWCVARA